MAPVAVEIMAGPGSVVADDEEIRIVGDVDSLSSTEVMLGCGNDNPY